MTAGLTVPRKRLGIFGGAFDPPHLAHVALAQVAINQLQLDTLWVIPTGHAWHKTRTLSQAVHRLAMTGLAFESDAKVVVDDREARRPGPSYTIDTVVELQAENPLTDWFLIIGADQAGSFTSWHRWQDLMQCATICVADRDSSGMATADFAPPAALKDRVLRLKMPSMPISATAIRARVAHHEPIAALVGEPVARYIAQHHLYL